jgi:hypothetical protein
MCEKCWIVHEKLFIIYLNYVGYMGYEFTCVLKVEKSKNVHKRVTIRGDPKQ